MLLLQTYSSVASGLFFREKKELYKAKKQAFYIFQKKNTAYVVQIL